jgi:hypothetical protein
MGSIFAYIVEHHQPLIGLIIGACMVVFAVVVNYGNKKKRALNWIATHIYWMNPKSDVLSRRLLERVTAYLATVGPMLIISAGYFLEYIK